MEVVELYGGVRTVWRWSKCIELVESSKWSILGWVTVLILFFLSAVIFFFLLFTCYIECPYNCIHTTLTPTFFSYLAAFCFPLETTIGGVI